MHCGKYLHACDKNNCDIRMMSERSNYSCAKVPENMIEWEGGDKERLCLQKIKVSQRVLHCDAIEKNIFDSPTNHSVKGY